MISDTGARIIGLNEVDQNMARSNFTDQAQLLGDRLEMNYVFGPTISKVFSKYGNAVLTSFPIKSIKNHSLPIESTAEPRSLLEVELKIPFDSSFNSFPNSRSNSSSRQELLVMVTHLSPDKKNRRKQLDWLRGYIDKIEQPFILMGDFNSARSDLITGYQNLSQNVVTYPSQHPSAAIDRFFTNLDNIQNPEVIKNNFSDHLPLITEFAS